MNEPRPPVLVDVDGDGKPDPVTPGPRPAPRWSPAGPPGPSDLAREGHEDRPSLAVVEGRAVALAEEPQDQDRIDVRASAGGRVFGHAAARRDAALRPVVPAVLRSWTEFRALVEVYGAYYRHMALYHLARLPMHAWGRAWRAARGAYRVEVMFTRWAADVNARKVENFYVNMAAQGHKEGGKEFQNTRRVKSTAWFPWVAAHVALALALTWVWRAAHPGIQAIVLVALVGILARIGTDPGKPAVALHGVPLAAPKVTTDAVVAALLSLGIEGINKIATKGYEGPGIQFPGIGPHRDGPGCRVDVDLPLGVTAAAVMEKREGLASGLRRPIGCVWPDGAPKEHPGRLVVWVGDKPFSDQPQPRWPLLKAGAADLFEPIPVAWDQRSGRFDLLLMYGNVLVGALPGAGKSGWGKVIASAAALDPTCELHVHELKGTGDYTHLKPIAHRYTSAPPSEESLDSVMNSIREVHGYLAPRARTIGLLPESEVGTERKVTRKLGNRRDLGLWPVLLVVDECQELFESEHGAEAETLLKAIIKRGRALGIILVLLTQRPDKDSLPRSISANAGIRICLRVTGQVENDMILGTSAYKAGMRATMFDDTDLGVAYVRSGARGKIARAQKFDDDLARAAGAQALELRTAAGTLTGDAAGQGWEPDVTITVDVVDDCRRMFRDGERGLHGSVLLDRLVEHRPGHYDGWRERDLTGVLKASDVRAGVDVKVKGVTKKGVYLADLLNAINPPEDAPAIEAGDEDDADFYGDDPGVADGEGPVGEVAVLRDPPP